MSRSATKSARIRGPRSAEEYFNGHAGEMQETLRALREFVKATLPTATEDFKWGAPVYTDRNGFPLCYIFAVRDHVNLGFISGSQLKDARGILEGSGKQGRHVKVYSPEDIRKTAFRELLREAARVARCQAKEGVVPGCHSS